MAYQVKDWSNRYCRHFEVFDLAIIKEDIITLFPKRRSRTSSIAHSNDRFTEYQDAMTEMK
jgi:hypothetical protein